MKLLTDLIEEIKQKELEKVRKRVHAGTEMTTLVSIETVRNNVPVAFGELKDSVHAITGAIQAIEADAPHAAAVEVGSAPHMPDLEALTKWVKLRGMQGLHKASTQGLSRWPGTTTRAQSRRIKRMLASLVKEGDGDGKHSPIDAAEQVARAIAKGIEEHGTRPHWFMKDSLPKVCRDLNRLIKQYLRGG